MYLKIKNDFLTQDALICMVKVWLCKKLPFFAFSLYIYTCTIYIKNPVFKPPFLKYIFSWNYNVCFAFLMFINLYLTGLYFSVRVHGTEFPFKSLRVFESKRLYLVNRRRWNNEIIGIFLRINQRYFSSKRLSRNV